MEAFSEFVLKAQPEIRPKICHCALIQPYLQNYFKTSLQPIFDSFESTKTTTDLLNQLISNLINNSPILPHFIIKILQKDENPSKLFYNGFLFPFLNNSEIFNLIPLSFSLNLQDKIRSFTISAHSFFSDKPGKRFIKQLLSNHSITSPGSMLQIPSEALVQKLDKNYRTITLIDSPDGFFVIPLNSTEIQTQVNESSSPAQITKFVKDFLIHIKPICLEKDFPSPEDYFKELYHFSSTFYDPKLEELLDLIINEIRKQSMTILQIIHTVRYDYLENPDLEVEENLLVLSEYNEQAKIIKSLTKYIHQIPFHTQKSLVFPLIQEKFYQFFLQPQFINFLQSLFDFSNTSELIQGEYEYLKELQLMTAPSAKKSEQIIPVPNRNLIGSTLSFSIGGKIQDPNIFLEFFNLLVSYIKIQEFTSINSFITDTFVYQSLLTLTVNQFSLYDIIKINETYKQENLNLHTFLSTHKDDLYNQQNAPFLDVYKKDPEKLSLFKTNIQIALSSSFYDKMLLFLVSAFESIETIIEINENGEIGADQLVPLEIIAMIQANPMGIATCQHFLEKFIVPLVNDEKSPLHHDEDYYSTQYLSFCQFIQEQVNQSK